MTVKQLMLAWVSTDGHSLRNAAAHLKSDKEVVREGIRSTELDHPCYAVPTAGVPCLLDILKYDGASTEVARAATMGVNSRFAFVYQSADSTPIGHRD